ncbi:hypothetical protein MTO99_16400 [Agromyces larvae]|uniref:Uncharacterized protein n=1 Tax=Agromyces larvae TaxID=2929802 RepID=A0ABY4BWZ1_9MICO|nr:hypothetical protein [Agromyces larvae]UOE43730.1 hypothetical protein MTO99_16400 [Agromyces larvae]
MGVRVPPGARDSGSSFDWGRFVVNAEPQPLVGHVEDDRERESASLVHRRATGCQVRDRVPGDFEFVGKFANPDASHLHHLPQPISGLEGHLFDDGHVVIFAQ